MSSGFIAYRPAFNQRRIESGAATPPHRRRRKRDVTGPNYPRDGRRHFTVFLLGVGGDRVGRKMCRVEANTCLEKL